MSFVSISDSTSHSGPFLDTSIAGILSALGTSSINPNFAITINQDLTAVAVPSFDGPTGNFLDIETNAPYHNHFALKSTYRQSAEPTTYDIYTLPIGSTGSTATIGSTGSTAGVIGTVIPDTVKISVTENSTVYDTFINIASTNNVGPFYSLPAGTSLLSNTYPGSTTSPYSAVFTSTSVRDNQIKAKNSEFNTAGATARPLSVADSNAFNSTSAMNAESGKYFIDHGFTGLPEPVDILNGNKLVDNLFGITGTTWATEYGVTGSTSFGIYKFEQAVVLPTATGSTGSIADYPFSGASGSFGSLLDGNLSGATHFYSIFDATKPEPGYEFKLTVTHGNTSGYTLDLANTDRVYESGSTGVTIFTIDDSALKNNMVYMNSSVTKDHSISIQNNSLSIDPDVGATAQGAYFTLSTGAETLGNTAAGTNGQINLNVRDKTSRTTHTGETGVAGLSTNVLYSGDTAISGQTGIITNDVAVYKDVAYTADLIIKKTDSTNASNTDPFFKVANTTTYLNMYNNEVVNDKFDPTTVDFGSTGTHLTDITLLKIEPSKKLVAIDGFMTAGNTAIGISSTAYLTNYNPPIGETAGAQLSNAIMNFSLKTLSASTIYGGATASGWSIETNTSTIMPSSFASAYSTSAKMWPSVSVAKSLITDINNAVAPELTYNISIVNGQTGPSAYSSETQDLLDTIRIDWSYSGTSGTVDISQHEMVRTVASGTTTTSQPLQTFDVAQVDLTGRLVGRAVTLVQKQSTRQFTWTAPLNLRPFTGLTVTTPTLTSTTTYWTAIDTLTGDPYPQSYLSDISGQDYTIIQETITAPNLSFVGVLHRADLCDLDVVVNASTGATLTSTYSVSSYYGIPLNMELDNLYELESNKVGDITLTLETDYMYGYEENSVILNEVNGYKLQLTGDYKANYTITSFMQNVADMTTTTSVYTVTDGFAPVDTAWSSANITHNVEYDDAANSQTLTISVDGVTYSITSNDYSMPLVTMFISAVKDDIWYKKRTLGSDPLTSTYTKEQYSDSMIKQDSGVYIMGATSALTKGAHLNYSLRPDQVSCNMVGSAGPLTDITSLTNTLGDVTDARTFNVNRFRGFNGLSNQTYIISRPRTTATFAVEADTQTSAAIYNGSSFVIDALTTNGNINLIFNFGVSMLAEGDYSSGALEIDIYVSADALTYTSASPTPTTSLPSGTTLKDSAGYDFPGANYNSTGSPLIIKPSRVKLQSTEYLTTQNLDNVTWTLSLSGGNFTAYKSSNYLGEPAAVSVWVPVGSTTDYETMKTVGFSIAGYNITRPPNSTAYASTSYFTIVPPHLEFNQMAYDAGITFPYTYNPSNSTIRYNRVTDGHTYTPFQNDDLQVLNNVTFSELNIKNYSDYKTSTDSNDFVVEGDILTIASKTSTMGITVLSPGLGLDYTFFTSPANRLLYQTTIDTTSNPVKLLKMSGTSGAGVQLELLQKVIYQMSYSALYPNESDFSNANGNIGLVIDNFFLGTSTTTIDLVCGAGSDLELYTVNRTYPTTLTDTVTNITVTINKFTSTINNIFTEQTNYRGLNRIVVDMVPTGIKTLDIENPLKTLGSLIADTFLEDFYTESQSGASNTLNPAYDNYIYGSVLNLIGANLSWDAPSSAINQTVTIQTLLPSSTNYDDIRNNNGKHIFANLSNSQTKALIITKTSSFEAFNVVGYQTTIIDHKGKIETKSLTLTPSL